MNLSLARRLGAVLLLVCAFVGNAHASKTWPTQPEAFAACNNSGAIAPATINGDWEKQTPRCEHEPSIKRYQCYVKYRVPSSGAEPEVHCAQYGPAGNDSTHYYTEACPNGVNPMTGLCDLSCPGGYGEDPFNPGQCLDEDACQARNNEPGFAGVGAIATSSTNRCVSGCQYKSTGPSVCTTLGGQQVCSADMEFSGAACSPTVQTKDQAADEKDDKQKCTPAGSGQTFCVKPNGDQCYSATSGRQICWGPGETGVKNDNNAQQKRDAGEDSIPPNLNLPNGDTLEPNAPPVTTTTNVNNGNGGGTNVTTTTTTYVTTNGTNPGGGTPGSGEPGDGSGSGEGEGEGNGSTGGGDCEHPPVNKGDPLLGQIAMQTYHTRCEAAGRDTALRGEAAELDTDDGAEEHQDDLTKLWNDGESDSPFQADESGFGLGSSCPAAPTILGQQLTWADGRACEIMIWLGLLVILMAHAHALYIILGD